VHHGGTTTYPEQTMSYFSDASLVLVPSAQKSGKVYSIKPTDGTGDLTFTRSNDTATRVASNGLIERVRTNTILQSQTFENASWSKVSVGTGVAPVVTANAGAAPDGTTTADRIVFDTGAGTTSSDRSIFRQTISATTSRTGSFYIKSNTGSSQSVGFHDGAQTTIVTVTTSWQRFSVPILPSDTLFGLENRGDNATAGTCDVLLWGAQVETGDIATDYIATTSAAVSVGPVANVPRLDYLGSSCPRLLLEPQRTNIATYSEQFDNVAGWTLYNGTQVANTTETLDPSGYYGAEKAIMGGTDSATYRKSIGGLTNGDTYTFSLYIKQGSGVTAFLDICDASTTPDITPTSEWVRYTKTGVWDTSLNFVDIELRGTSGSFCYIWGAQLELASFETSYIPTLGAVVTRGGDDCGTTSLQSASLIGATAGTFFVETIKTDDSIWFNQRILLTSTTVRSLLIDTSAGQIRLRTWDAASAGATITTSGLANGLVKYLIKWDGTNIKVFANGVLQGSSAQPSYAYTTYTAYESTSYSNNTISQLLFFPTALSDSDCIALTA
jgi:hypothetical protein